MFSYIKSFFAQDDQPAQEGADMFDVPQESFKLLNILTDLKFNLMQVLLAKTVFEKYFSDFENTKFLILNVVLEQRGMPRQLYEQLLDTSRESLHVAQLLSEIDSIQKLFQARPSEITDLIDSLLPKKEGLGSMRHINSHMAVAIVDLACKFKEAYIRQWEMPQQRDIEIFQSIMVFARKFLNVPEMESYDCFNLLQANIVRAMFDDPTQTIVSLTWIRLSYLMSVSDTNWQINKTIKESTPGCPDGIIRYLHETTDRLKQELTKDQKASFMSVSDCMDIRAYFIQFESSINVRQSLVNLHSHSKLRPQTPSEVMEANLEEKMTLHLGAREQANQQYDTFGKYFRSFTLAALALIVQTERKCKETAILNALNLDANLIDVNKIFEDLYTQLIDTAVMVCEDEKCPLSPAAFSLFLQKFEGRDEVQDALKLIDKRISQIFEFDPLYLKVNEKKDPFAAMVMRYDHCDLIKGSQLAQIQNALASKVSKSRTDKSTYDLQQILEESVTVDTRGLTAFDYLSLCSYYETQPFPTAFELKHLDK